MSTIARLPASVTYRRPRTIVIVGCGGIGSRLIPPLSKMISPTQQVVLIDPDVVEAHNLDRQHFTLTDVGEYKAQVMARRYFPDHDAERLSVYAHLWEQVDFSQFYNVQGTIVISGVDTRRARATIAHTLAGVDSVIWIDAGNARREGQVLMSVFGYRAFVEAPGVFSDPEVWKLYRMAAGHSVGNELDLRNFKDHWPRVGVPTLETVLPALLDASQESAEVPCAVRVDTQTVAANLQAAASAVSLFSYVQDGVPLNTLGCTFSCCGAMTPLLAYLPRRPARAGSVVNGVWSGAAHGWNHTLEVARA